MRQPYLSCLSVTVRHLSVSCAPWLTPLATTPRGRWGETHPIVSHGITAARGPAVLDCEYNLYIHQLICNVRNVHGVSQSNCISFTEISLRYCHVNMMFSKGWATHTYVRKFLYKREVFLTRGYEFPTRCS